MQNTKPKKSLTKKSEILQEALKYLDVKSHSHPKDKYEFICHCINQVVNNDPSCFTDSSGLISIIEERLGEYDTFNSYLYHNHGIHPETQEKKDGRKLQYTRLQWVLSMIKEFKAQGD